jgi:hypothetical protein
MTLPKRGANWTPEPPIIPLIIISYIANIKTLVWYDMTYKDYILYDIIW